MAAPAIAAPRVTEARVSRGLWGDAFRRLMRNAWLPVVTVLGLQVGGLLGGAVITETVFGWGGVGRYIVDAIENRDYLVIENTILIFALVFLVVNLIVDIGYAFLNPRIRYA